MSTVRSRNRASQGRDDQPKPRSDAYTGLLLLALLAQIAGAVFLFLDYSQYYHKDASGNMTTEPPKVQPLAASPALTPAAAPAGNPPAANPPPANPPPANPPPANPPPANLPPANPPPANPPPK